jgi:superfamily II DNA or RNA helicase
MAESSSRATFGDISLQPHQMSAVTRLRTALEQFNGALLCDDVGMGKTYVATAVAQQYTRCLVVAPAALVSMWRDALTATRTVADILTFEALSRADADDFRRHAKSPARTPYDLVVVEEAHHTRNTSTNRYLPME